MNKSRIINRLKKRYQDLRGYILSCVAEAESGLPLSDDNNKTG